MFQEKEFHWHVPMLDQFYSPKSIFLYYKKSTCYYVDYRKNINIKEQNHTA